MRVLIEQRPDTGARQLLQLEDLLEACNSPSVEFSEADGENATVGNWPNYRTVECKQFEFGSKGFLYDIWVMSQADVLVSLHGAGQINSNFMPQHSSVIEVSWSLCIMIISVFVLCFSVSAKDIMSYG